MKPMNTNTARFLASATAGLVLFGLTSVASARPGRGRGHQARPAVHHQSEYGFDTRRERALERRVAAIQRDIRLLSRDLEGFSDAPARQAVMEAKAEVRGARVQIRSASYRAASRSLGSAEAAVISATDRVVQLRRVKRQVGIELARTSTRLADVRAMARTADCSVTGAHIRRAEGDLREARRDARRGDWFGARAAVRDASGHVSDANTSALAAIERRRQRRAFNRELASLDANLAKARRNISTLTRRPAPRRTLAQARNERDQAVTLAAEGKFRRANILLDRSADTARFAVREAGDVRRARRDTRVSRRGHDNIDGSRTWVFSSL